MNKRARLFIFGHVVGVGFRSWTVNQATKLGLTGWVRNYDYHTVEILLEGPKDKLEEMIKMCKQGPEVSKVEKVEAEWSEVTGEYEGFGIKYV